VYVETVVPLISAKQNLPGVRNLDLQLAARRDSYSITGANLGVAVGAAPPEPAIKVTQKLSSLDPTASIRFQPIEAVTFRASYGTGFLPPDVSQLVPEAPSEGSGLDLGLTDPRRGNEPVGTFTNLSGGNPDLRPEKSTSLSAGVILTPRAMPGLRLSVDWIRIRKRDNVASFGADQKTIDSELFIPGYITRGPASGGYDVGPIQIINSEYLNVARQEVEAVDFTLDYRLQSESWGTFTISAGATHNLHNVTQVIATTPEVELLKTNVVLPWNANAELGWERHNWTLDWAARYLDSYCLLTGCLSGPSTVAQGSRSIGSQIYHDVGAAYHFGFADVRVVVKNVFDRQPPTLTTTPYYSTLADARVRSYLLSVSKNFF
jgi:outer membrane receptor protein involved in Fe transport